MGPLQLVPACPGRIAPRIDQFGDGLRAAYTLVTQGASPEERHALSEGMAGEGFARVGNISMNDRVIVFVRSGRTLQSQVEADREFAVACRLGSGPVYLTQARYNMPAEDSDGEVRVR